MSVANRIDEQAYLELAAREQSRFLELWDGEPKAKPSMSYEHNHDMSELGFALRQQIDPSLYEIRVNSGRLRHTAGNVFIPDVMVVPTNLAQTQRGQPGRLETYDAPMPLVVEVWSRSTGDYDLSVKLAAYQARGDAEIWRLHPYERTLTCWVRQADGTYAEEAFAGGLVALAALPGVAVDLDALFTR
ncbi:MAG: Uma2 family endonuclease [Chloroflexia bacterium]|nr:Uma2 family endonuclease [Chloroflexia bacterium]